MPASSLDPRMNHLRDQLAGCQQTHLLTFWPMLSEAQRTELLGDLEQINLEALPNLTKLVRGESQAVAGRDRLEPPVVIKKSHASISARTAGEDLLRAGRVAALMVAGGQGTRLGFNGPKGAFPISPVKDKTLFQLFAEAIAGASRRYGKPVPWYIMTSPANDADTRNFFASHDRFGLASDQIVFFQQGVMPAFDRQGRILLDQPHRVALSPDGHGGSLLAMARAGVLADMARRGVEHISYFQVDNPLVNCIDPLFLGLHAESGSEMSSKTLPKADDLERVGNFVMADGKLTVVEYSDFPEALARARNADGTRRFDAANIAVHALTRSFVERLTADASRFALPWHRAEKKVPFVDLQSGKRVEPASPNAVKLEAFVFDALPLASKTLLMETAREEEFSPVKNAEGVDSAATARRDMSRRAARWLTAAGVSIAHGPDGEPAGVYEISPLAATEEAHVREAAGRLSGESLKAGCVYIE